MTAQVLQIDNAEMANIALLLAIEIGRISRKEIRRQFEPFKRAAAKARADIAALKRQVRSLELELRRARKNAKPQISNDVVSVRKVRFQSAGLKAHRAKIGLSAKDYGLLTGASQLSVYKWENGKVTPRRNMLPKITEVMRMGKREATRRLLELQER